MFSACFIANLFLDHIKVQQLCELKACVWQANENGNRIKLSVVQFLIMLDRRRVIS